MNENEIKNNKALVLETPGKKVLFTKLSFIYPECGFLIKDHPQLHPLKCFVDSCPRNMGCFQKLAKRILWLFDSFKKAELVVLYYTYPDKPGSTRGAAFYKDLDKPVRHIVFNRTAWEYLKEKGDVYEITLPDQLFLPSKNLT